MIVVVLYYDKTRVRSFMLDLYYEGSHHIKYGWWWMQMDSI